MDEHLLRFDSDKTYVFIDCETENLCLHEGHNLPWQIAMIKAKGGKKIDEKDYYVKWDRELSVSKEAARITRFNPVDHKKKALYYKDIFPTIEDWLHNCDYIVGHNILGFDIYLLKSYYESMGKPYKPSENFLQYQYKVYHVRKKGLRNSLTALGKEFSIEHNYEMLHDAIVDLELNLKVWNQLKYQIEF
jgi:DNA polymerase III alpha subunit (gram-positive type)